MNAKMCFIGEAPGLNEDVNGTPFIGNAGQLLRKTLRNFGIDDKECLYLNIFNERPPNNYIGYFYADRQKTKVKPEHEHLLEEFFEDLENTDCCVYILLGDRALHHLTGNSGINKYRGSVLEITGSRKALACLHPSAVLRQRVPGRQGNYRQLFKMDIAKAIRNSKTKGFQEIKRVYNIPMQFDNQIDAIRSLSGSEFLSVDIETTNRAISCIGFSNTPEEGTCIPFIYNGKWMHSDVSRAILWTEISKLLHGPSKKIWQNGYFDYTILGGSYKIRPVNVHMDTMLAHHICYPDMLKGLDFLASIYTNEVYWKDEGKQWDNVRDYKEFWRYNIKDACVTLACAREIEKQVQAKGLEDIVKTYTDLTYGPVLKTTLMGINYDISYTENYRLFLELEIDKTYTKLRALAKDDKLNANSPKQICELLYDKMKYKKQFVTKDGKKKLTSDDGAICKCKLQRPSPILDMILSLRRMMKMKSTYLGMPFDPITGRMYTSYNTSGTETLRLSSGPAPFKIGGNLLNLPRKDTEERMYYNDETDSAARS